MRNLELYQIPYHLAVEGSRRVDGPGSLVHLCGKAVVRDPAYAAEVRQRKNENEAQKSEKPGESEQSSKKLDVLPAELVSYLCRMYTCRLCKEPTCEEGHRVECCPPCSHRISACNECSSPTNLWLCLTCGHLGCGRASSRHAVTHNEATNHPLVLQLANPGREPGELWCYSCDTWHSYGGPTLREWLATLGVPFDLLTMPS